MPGVPKLARTLERGRVGRGLTPADAAEALRVVPTTILDWEAGRRMPHRHHLASIAELYGIELDGDDGLEPLRALWVRSRREARRRAAGTNLLAAILFLVGGVFAAGGG